MSRTKYPLIDVIVFLFILPLIWATLWATLLSLIIFKHLGLGVIGAVAGLFMGGFLGWMGLWTQGGKPVITRYYIKHNSLYVLFTSLPWIMFFGLTMSEFYGVLESIMMGLVIGLINRLPVFISGLVFKIPPLTWRTPVWILGGILLGFFLRFSITLMIWNTDFLTKREMIWGIVRWSLAGGAVGWLNALGAERRNMRM